MINLDHHGEVKPFVLVNDILGCWHDYLLLDLISKLVEHAALMLLTLFLLSHLRPLRNSDSANLDRVL